MYKTNILKILLKEILKDLSKCKKKRSYGHGIEDLILLRWPSSPNLSTDSCIRILASFFLEMDMLILKFIQNYKGP